jgi:hypothetical protein
MLPNDLERREQEPHTLCAVFTPPSPPPTLASGAKVSFSILDNWQQDLLLRQLRDQDGMTMLLTSERKPRDWAI